MGNCDPACQKIIINSGLVAIAAGELRRVAHPGTMLETAAFNLAETTGALVKAHDVLMTGGALKKVAHAKWDGCEEASGVMAMATAVASGGEFDEAESVGQLNGLRFSFLGHLHSLVSGKL